VILNHAGENMKEINLDNPIGAEKARQLPDPKGYRMLIMLPQMEEKTEGGVILPDEHRAREETATIVGFVLKMGDLCYKDPDKFPTGPWCKEGDWVLFRSYSGNPLLDSKSHHTGTMVPKMPPNTTFSGFKCHITILELSRFHFL